MQSSSSRNPIALRIHKVLGTNFSDAATQQTLATLSELYAHPVIDLPPSKHHTDDQDDLFFDDDELPHPEVETITAYAENVPGEAAALARKNLQRDIESKLAEGSKQFLVAFGEVDNVCTSKSN